MIYYAHLEGRKFVHGITDCYGLARDFYKEFFEIDLPNWAREDEWWEKGEDGPNFYMKHAHELGFRILDDLPVRDMQLGDCPVMAIQSTVPNHVGVYVGDGKILHHFYNQLSIATPYKGLWRNATTAILRHKDVVHKTPVYDQVELFDLLPDQIKQRFNDPRVAR
jgi:cell wall-associated NlpC family hydrolase